MKYISFFIIFLPVIFVSCSEDEEDPIKVPEKMPLVSNLSVNYSSNTINANWDEVIDEEFLFDYELEFIIWGVDQNHGIPRYLKDSYNWPDSLSFNNELSNGFFEITGIDSRLEYYVNSDPLEFSYNVGQNVCDFGFIDDFYLSLFVRSVYKVNEDSVLRGDANIKSIFIEKCE